MAVGWFPGPVVSSETVSIMKKVLADGKPVAASANASIILAEASLFKRQIIFILQRSPDEGRKLEKNGS
jgi:hypothetical protein